MRAERVGVVDLDGFLREHNHYFPLHEVVEAVHVPEAGGPGHVLVELKGELVIDLPYEDPGEKKRGFEQGGGESAERSGYPQKPNPRLFKNGYRPGRKSRRPGARRVRPGFASRVTTAGKPVSLRESRGF